jgi:hypothetical protein
MSKLSHVFTIISIIAVSFLGWSIAGNPILVVILFLIGIGVIILSRYSEIGLAITIYGYPLYQTIFTELGYTQNNSRYLLLAAYGGIAFYILQRLNKEKTFVSGIIKNPSLLLTLGFSFWMVFQSLRSNNPAAAFARTQAFFFLGVLPTIALHFYINDLTRIRNLFYISSSLGIVYIIISIANLENLSAFTQYTILNMDSVVYSQSLIFAIVFLLYLGDNTKKKSINLEYLV